jgi:hypothetical protein
MNNIHQNLFFAFMLSPIANLSKKAGRLFQRNVGA